MVSRLPRLYPILDFGRLDRAGIPFEGFARSLRAAGIRFLQYRDKLSSDGEVLARAAFLRSVFPAADSCLILNDRVSLTKAALFDGVHVGQQDLSPAKVRAFLGPEMLVGASTHNVRQLSAGDSSPANYLAIGPAFATSSKENPDPIVGLEGIRAARRTTEKPLVAIGGITRANCISVLEAGADSMAVISDLLPRPGEPAERAIEEFLSILT
ncbi:MAG TPA: thiamine phosphate synthase [Acidobacteriaceae bacterium]